MPISERVEVEGCINLRDGHLVLRVDGGGEWQLDCGLWTAIRAQRLLGRPVTVRGTRDGHDLIAGRAIDVTH